MVRRPLSGKIKGLACLKGGNPIEVIYGIGPYLNGHDGRIRRRFYCSGKMTLNVLWILVGIALVLWGADRLTDGAVAVAEQMRVPQIVIGLTVVAMGTSMPEFLV